MENTIPATVQNMPWTTTGAPPKKDPKSGQNTRYVPLLDTLRLFAGWLLAWYGLSYVLGMYQLGGKAPLEVPIVESLGSSPLILRLTVAIFLFLLLSSIHKWTGGGALKGILLIVAGAILFGAFHVNA